MKIGSLFFISFCAVLVETLFLHIPLTLFCIVMIALFYRKEWVFGLALFAGIFLDSLSFRFIGESSLFFLITVAIIFLYQRKFETRNIFFGGLFLCLAIMCYTVFFGAQ